MFIQPKRKAPTEETRGQGKQNPTQVRMHFILGQLGFDRQFPFPLNSPEAVQCHNFKLSSL